MGRSRNLADVISGAYDIPLSSLDNVPASNDASALTTGTLPIARIADGAITAGKLSQTYLTPTGDGSGLTGIASDALSKSLPLASGTTVATRDFVSLNGSGEVGEYPVTNTVNNDLANAGLSDYIDRMDSSGTRFLQMRYTDSSGNRQFYLRGTAYDDTTGTFTEGSETNFYGWNTNEAHNGNGGYGVTWIVEPLKNTGKFVCIVVNALYGWNVTGANRSGGQINGRLITVNSDGSISTHQTFSTSEGLYNTNYGYYRSSNIYNVHHYRVQAGSQTTGRTRSVHINADETSWTVTDEGTNNSDGSNFSGVTFRDLGNSSTAYAISNSGGTIRKTAFAVSTNLTGNGTTTDEFDLDNYNNYLSLRSSQYETGIRRVFATYLDGAGSHRISVIDVEDDGTVVERSNNIIPSSQEAFTGSNTYIGGIVVDSTRFIAYNNGKINTVEFNADGTLKGYGITGWNNSNVSTYKYTPTDGKLHVWISGSTNKQTIDLNAFSTSEYSFGGVAKADASSGNVDLVVGGVVGGFTGLTAGQNYSINKSTYDGSVVLSSDLTNAGVLVGKAISSTEILLAGVQA